MTLLPEDDWPLEPPYPQRVCDVCFNKQVYLSFILSRFRISDCLIFFACI